MPQTLTVYKNLVKFAAMMFAKLLLYPVSLLYGLAIWIRNRLYDLGWLKSTRFDQPVIVIGNLLAGGTGKSPMTEYFVKLLASKYRIATLSRGYGRKTTGFYNVNTCHLASEVGDEPLQFKRKFPDITVAVCEDRVAGVKFLLQEHDVVLLDDAFQHRALIPGFSLLLFDYQSLQKPKWLLPAGPYRDLFAERKRADVLIVTKSPKIINQNRKQQIRKEFTATLRQPLFFSTLSYSQPFKLLQSGQLVTGALNKDTYVLLVTGIAHPEPLLHYLQEITAAVDHIIYKDHHQFTENDINHILRCFNQITAADKILITTEKDAQRFNAPAFIPLLKDIPFYYIGIHTVFDEADGEMVNKLLLDYCQQEMGKR